MYMLPNKVLDKWYENEKYEDRVRKYKGTLYALGKQQKVDEATKVLCQLYNYVKTVALKYYDKKTGMHYGYDIIKNLIINCEFVFPKSFIIDNKPCFSYMSKISYCSSKENNETILNSIVNVTRNMLYRLVNFNSKDPIPFEKCDLTNMCFRASKFIEGYCQRIGIDCQIVLVEPGFIKNSDLYGGYGVHYFNIVTINGIKYLVDCTYSQFFFTSNNLIERIGVPEISSCNVGIYMMMYEHRRRVAEKILRDGWITLTDEVFKDYLDGFAISYRNGLYYEHTHDFSYTTNYSSADYIRFLNGDDSQLHHEDREYLGCQKRPLKKARLNFNKK